MELQRTWLFVYTDFIENKEKMKLKLNLDENFGEECDLQLL